MSSNQKLTSLKEVIQFTEKIFRNNPHRNRMTARMAAREGRIRSDAAIALSHLAVPGDEEIALPGFTLPEIKISDVLEYNLACDIINLLAPLNLDNPISPCLCLGKGTSTQTVAFGIPVDEESVGAPAFTKSLDEILHEDPPDPFNAGLMPEMLEKIDLIKSHLPPFFKIKLPDMQGPYNIAHSIIGQEALTAPYLEPEAFYSLMERVTTNWVDTRRILLERIGADYMDPDEQTPLIAECSVNLVSAEIYRKHILPHDMRIVRQFGPVRVHTCSGPHVFRVTLECLPIIETECGYIACATAGYTTVEEGFNAVLGKPILLNIGSEIHGSFDEAFNMIKQDLDLYAAHPKMMFGYTGMKWRKKDRPSIRLLHKRLDEYWTERYGRRSHDV